MTDADRSIRFTGSISSSRKETAVVPENEVWYVEGSHLESDAGSNGVSNGHVAIVPEERAVEWDGGEHPRYWGGGDWSDLIDNPVGAYAYPGDKVAWLIGNGDGNTDTIYAVLTIRRIA